MNCQVGYFDIGGNKAGILFEPSPVSAYATEGLSYGFVTSIIAMVALISFYLGLKRGKPTLFVVL